MLRLTFYKNDRLIAKTFRTRVKCYSYIYDNDLTEYWINGTFYTEIEQDD